MDFNKKSYLKRQMAFYRETDAFVIKKEDCSKMAIVNFELEFPECNKDNSCEECKFSKKLEEEYKTENDKCNMQ